MSNNQRQSWDFGRFTKTLSYFGIIPFIGSFDWLKKLFGGKSSKVQPPTSDKGVILVAGATGGVGKRVVRRLQQRGYNVRSLVRDAKRGREILGDKVELVEADITLPETLNQSVTRDVKALICCTGTRVQPVEGDTPNREKYYQGIKFYLPEVAETPEYIEYRGIENLVNALRSQLAKARNEKPIFDFTNPTQDIKEIWGALDDVVMGGVSESFVQLTSDGALFTGNVSTANSGGFTSIRTRLLDPPLDLSAYDGIQLRVKGDGNRYKFLLRSDAKWDGIGYSYSFDTVYNTWITVRIPFDELIPVFRAKTVESQFDPSHVTSFQLMLSKFEYDGELNPKFKPGTFRIEVESIQAYGGDKLPQFVMISSAGVTRPGRPGLNLDEEPPAVRMNEQLGGILTWKLKGEDSVRQSGIPYAIVRPCALTEKPGGKTLQVDQGDTIKGQCSREDIAELCIQALNDSQACNVTFEVKEAETNGKGDRDWGQLFSQLQSDRELSAV